MQGNTACFPAIYALRCIVAALCSGYHPSRLLRIRDGKQIKQITDIEKRTLKKLFRFFECKLKGDLKMKFGKRFSVLGATLFFGASLLAASVPQSGQQPAPDNTKNNQGDAGKDATTADQQKMNPADRNTTKQIRKAIMQDSPFRPTPITSRSSPVTARLR